MQDDVERERRHAECRSHRMIARPVEEVMRLAVTRESSFEERPRVQQEERDAGKEDRGIEGVGDLEAERAYLYRREQSQRSFDPPQPPVGLCRRSHLLRSERTVEPHRIHLDETA